MSQSTRHDRGAGNLDSKRLDEARSGCGRSGAARPSALLLAALLSAISACVMEPPNDIPGARGGSGSPGIPIDDNTPVTPGVIPPAGEECGLGPARVYFDSYVAPLIDSGGDNATGGKLCASCHSAGYVDKLNSINFLGDSPATYYDKLVTNPKYVSASPANSLFLHKGPHSGPEFDPTTQAPVVETWLGMEADARFIGCDKVGTPGGEPIGPTGEALVKQFIECMDFEDWVATGMDRVASTNTLQDGNCAKCHADGAGNNPMTDPLIVNPPGEVERGFNDIQTVSRIQNLITWTVNPQTGEVDGLKQSYRWRDKANDNIPPHKYLFPAKHVAAMDQWFAITMQKCFGE